MRKTASLVLFLAFVLSCGTSYARGGGGCVEEGTLILTPSGSAAVEKLVPGDVVLAVRNGQTCVATVEARTEVQPAEYIELYAAGRTLRVTLEHPVAVSSGVFRMASRLRAGDAVFILENGEVRAAELSSVNRVNTGRPAFNLLVAPGGSYVAGGMVLHNKGCFLPDTPILRADGSSVAIRDVKPGDELLAFTPDEAVTRAVVRDIVTREADEYVLVATESVTLEVTPEHPFYVGDGTFKTVEALKVGDGIFVLDGCGLARRPVVSIERIHARTLVYNLQTDNPHTYFAAGVAVHNKGGGGGGFGGGGFHSSGGGGSEDDWWVFLVIIAIVIAYYVIKYYWENRRSSRRDENLDYLFSRGNIKRKKQKTDELIEFIAKTDGTFAKEALVKVAANTFVTLQKCWQGRDYDPMKPLMMPDLYAEHCAQIEGQRHDHEINCIEGLTVDAVDVVNVRYTQKPDQREFTALITATARDYYIDDRTQAFLRGDDAPAQFQEFWTFHLVDGKWLLRQIEQTGESDCLKEDNFFEPFTEEGRKEVEGALAKQAGPAGPWLEKETGEKATKIERMLNFLVQTDKLWDRQKMIECVRSTFLRVYLAREKGDPAGVPLELLFPNLAQGLSDEILRLNQQGTGMEYRNLCVRKVEIILVRNFADNSQDEFTARVTAHAQTIVRREGAVIYQQEYVTAFEEYWTFGRLDGAWKLKEVEPPDAGKQMIGAENLDQDSNLSQLQWYYRQPRAT